MIVEALVYARARLSGQGDPHGHLSEQVGLWARHRRQRQAWAAHLDRARDLCRAAAAACPPALSQNRRRTALVLGAGLLLDVPLADLSALFRRVVLADLAFLPWVRAKAKRLGNVDCLEADLTACLELLPALAARHAETGAPPQAPLPDLTLGLPDLDFVYSANLLSQLPFFALSGLRKLAPGPHPSEQLDQQALDGFAASVVRAHLAALRGLPCPACLVTDVLERGLVGSRLDYEADLLFGVDLFPPTGLPGATWLWRMAPAGEAVPGLDVERVVLGVPDVRAGRAENGAGGRA